MLMALLVLVQIGSVPAADETPHPIFDRMAETIAAAAPETAHPYTRGWTSVGQRARLVRWHLAEPDDGDGWYRRTGWISEGGQQAGVAICGDIAGMDTLGLQISGEHPLPLVDALERIGTVTSEDNPAGHPVWRLEQAGRDTARVVASPVCTPPGSAAARSCRLYITVTYGSDVSDRGCLAP